MCYSVAHAIHRANAMFPTRPLPRQLISYYRFYLSERALANIIMLAYRGYFFEMGKVIFHCRNLSHLSSPRTLNSNMIDHDDCF